MAQWLTYFKERFPLPVYVTLVAGFVCSGTLIVGGQIVSIQALAAFIGLMVFFAMLRMMDEVKDFEKDKIANPTRPLPRGLLDVNVVKTVIQSTVLGMVGYAILLAVVFSLNAGSVYLFLTGWLWLMYREFYSGTWLEERQILYAITHQFILVPVTLLPIVLISPESLFLQVPWQFAGLVVGSFFTYEVCRKLNPNAHPLLHTYRQMYGVKKVFLIILCTNALAISMAYSLDIPYFAVGSVLVLVSYLVFLPKGKYKVVEGLATVSLVLHIWAIVIDRLKELL